MDTFLTSADGILAKGNSLKDAVQNAKDYISNALSAMLDLGKGSGPLNHGYMIAE